MPKKILYCASTVSHIMNFHLPYLKAFHEKGYEVWVAANEQKMIPYVDHVVALPFCKKITSIQNIRAVYMAHKLIRQERFDIVSTHTMLASAVIRAAILPLRHRPKVFCTVHGYLFNENDGLKKWKYLLPEKICARITDVLMVMNHEDFAIAEKHKLYHGKLHYINGMGIDLTKFPPITREERTAARSVYNLAETDIAYVYAAEFSKRKNQSFLIQAFAESCKNDSHLKLFLAGEGTMLNSCKNLTRRLGISDQVFFPGYINNIRDLYAACDVCVSTSLCEGLPFNVLEAMACGLPVIASNIKGHRELVLEKKYGSLFQNYVELKGSIEKSRDTTLKQSLRKVESQWLKKFALSVVLDDIMSRYKSTP